MGQKVGWDSELVHWLARSSSPVIVLLVACLFGFTLANAVRLRDCGWIRESVSGSNLPISDRHTKAVFLDIYQQTESTQGLGLAFSERLGMGGPQIKMSTVKEKGLGQSSFTVLILILGLPVRS